MAQHALPAGTEEPSTFFRSDIGDVPPTMPRDEPKRFGFGRRASHDTTRADVSMRDPGQPYVARHRAG